MTTLVSSAMRGRYANVFSRGAAGVIDCLIVAAVYLGAIWGMQAVWSVLNFESVSDVEVNRTLALALLPGILYTYFGGAWWLFGRTAGQALFGLRVVRSDGRKLTLVRSLARFFCTGISTALCFLGWAMIPVDRRNRALHDVLCRTVVVYDFDDRRVPPPEPEVVPHGG